MDRLEVPYEDLLRFLEVGLWAFLAGFGWAVDAMIKVSDFRFESAEDFEGLRGWRMREDEDEMKVVMVLEVRRQLDTSDGCYLYGILQTLIG